MLAGAASPVRLLRSTSTCFSSAHRCDLVWSSRSRCCVFTTGGVSRGRGGRWLHHCEWAAWRSVSSLRKPAVKSVIWRQQHNWHLNDTHTNVLTRPAGLRMSSAPGSSCSATRLLCIWEEVSEATAANSKASWLICALIWLLNLGVKGFL